MVAFLWDQVKKLSEWTRQRDGQVQLGHSQMCKLENAGLIPHLKKEEPKTIAEVEGTHEPEIMNETVVEEHIPIPALEPEPEVVEEVVKEVIEEVVEEVKKDVVPEIVNPIPEPIEGENIDELLEQYQKKLKE